VSARDHGLFRIFPLDGEAMLSTGAAPKPYRRFVYLFPR
jgi:hypothetical protein